MTLPVISTYKSHSLLSLVKKFVRVFRHHKNSNYPSHILVPTSRAEGSGDHLEAIILQYKTRRSETLRLVIDLNVAHHRFLIKWFSFFSLPHFTLTGMLQFGWRSPCLARRGSPRRPTRCLKRKRRRSPLFSRSPFPSQFAGHLTRSWSCFKVLGMMR